MCSWYYDLRDIKNSPSLHDGIDSDTEARYRKEGARFINDVGRKLNLRYDTCATGVVYFHRFYMFHSFKEFHRYVMGATCLFLAGKVEETPKKARDILKATGQVLGEQQMTLFGEDSKEELLTMERILLKTIKFDLQVDHPYKYMLRYAKTFKGDKTKIEIVVQNGWTFINDSLCTTLCLQWEPEIIAIALIHLACRLTKYEITDWMTKLPNYKGKWWDQFVEGATLELLESVCHQVLDFYSMAAPQQTASKDSPPQPKDPVKRLPPDADCNPTKVPKLDRLTPTLPPSFTAMPPGVAGQPIPSFQSRSTVANIYTQGVPAGYPIPPPEAVGSFPLPQMPLVAPFTHPASGQYPPYYNPPTHGSAPLSYVQAPPQPPPQPPPQMMTAPPVGYNDLQQSAIQNRQKPRASLVVVKDN